MKSDEMNLEMSVHTIHAEASEDPQLPKIPRSFARPGWHPYWLPDLLPARTAVLRRRIPARLAVSTPWLPDWTAARRVSPRQGEVVKIYFGISIHGGTLKWMVYTGKFDQNGSFGGTPVLGNRHMYYFY